MAFKPSESLSNDATKVNADSKLMYSGFKGAAVDTGKKHALEISEKMFKTNVDAMHHDILMKNQGMAGPLKLMMERDLASRVGRLPFLPSSSLMLDVLTGRDEEINFDSFLGQASDAEKVAPPYIVCDKVHFM